MEERTSSSAAVGGEKRVKSTAAKRPIKVVRISNPMKFKTSPSAFPALVQRLTGHGSDTVDIISKYDHPSHSEEEATPPPPPPPPPPPAAGVCPLELLNGAFDSRLRETFPW